MLPADRPDHEVGWPRAVQTGIAILGSVAFGAVALSYGYGFGGGGRTESYPQRTAVAFSAPNTPTHDVVVFAATGDSLFVQGSPFLADPGDVHDSTQIQIDTAGGDFSSAKYTDTVTTGVERDTVPPVTGAVLDSGAVVKSRVRYFARNGGWSPWSDTLLTNMTQPNLILWNAQSYADSAALWNDTMPSGVFETASQSVTANKGAVRLDDTLSSYLGYTKAMRYDFTHSADGCESITIRREIPFADTVRGAWIELDTRWSSNFSTTNATCAPNDHKWLFGDTKASENGRWAFYVGADSGPLHTFQVEHPTAGGGSGGYYLNDGPGSPGADAWDGEWHNVKLYFLNSSTCSSNDAAMKVWFDDVLWHDSIGFNTCNQNGTTPDSITGISFHHNKDDGPDSSSMSTWFVRIRAYSTNPGWN